MQRENGSRSAHAHAHGEAHEDGGRRGADRTGTGGGAMFAVADFDHDGSPDLYAFSRDPAFPSTRLAVFSGATDFQNLPDFRLTSLPATGGGFDWVFGIVP